MKKIDKQIFKALEEINKQHHRLKELGGCLIAMYIGTHLLDEMLKDLKGGNKK